MFTPSRLTVARHRRGLSKAALAQHVGLSTKSISDYEAGDRVPPPETLGRLSEVLGFPAGFFEAPEIEEPNGEGASFRARARMPAARRHAALAAGAIATDLEAWITRHFGLPKPNLPDLGGMNPETAAEVVRSEWGLGDRPISNVVHLLELHGVRVFSLVEDCSDVDAFSFWRHETPFVFLNTLKSAERSRFDAAHELGHLVLHRQDVEDIKASEREADAFASAFLMPKSSVLTVRTAFPTLEALIRLKKRWGVSVAALAYRLHSLGVIGDWHYRSLCIDIGRKGFRTKEPAEMDRETSQVLHKVFSALRKDKTKKQDVARELHLPPDELDKLLFSLVIGVLQGGVPAGPAAPPGKRPDKAPPPGWHVIKQT